MKKSGHLAVECSRAVHQTSMDAFWSRTVAEH